VVVGLVVRLLHGGFFVGTVHALHVAIGPGKVGFGQMMVAAISRADAVKDLEKRVLIAFPVGTLDAVIDEPAVELIGYLRYSPMSRPLAGQSKVVAVAIALPYRSTPAGM
jgi:hypothetical protein